MIPGAQRETATEINVSKTIDAKGADGLSLSPQMISAAAATLATRDTSTGISLLLMGTAISSDGQTITKGFHFNGQPRAPLEVQTVGTTPLVATQTGGTGKYRLRFPISVPVNRLNFSATFYVLVALNLVNLIVRRTSHTGPEVYNYNEVTKTEGFSVGTGQQTWDFVNIQDFRAGDISYVTMESDNPFSIEGNASGIPRVTLNTIQYTLDPYVTSSDGAGSFASQTAKPNPASNDLVFVEQADGSKRKVRVDQLPAGSGGGTAPTPSLHSFSVNIDSRVDLNTDLNVEHTLTFNVSNHTQLTALRLLVTEGDNKTLTTPVTDGLQSQNVTFTGTDTSSSGTLTLQLEADTSAGGTVTSNEVTIQIANLQTQEQAYVGALADLNDAATVDLSTLQAFDVTASASVFSFTQQVPNTEHVVIFTPENRDPTSIFNTSSNREAIAQYPQQTGVRSENGISYNIRSNQNNSGFTGTYHLRVTTE